MDGLFLQTLGGDTRAAPLWRMPQARRGMPLDGICFGQEHFHPTINQLAGGGIYLIAGHDHSTIVGLEGWDSVRRQYFGSFVVDSAALVGLPEVLVHSRARLGRPSATIAMRADGILVDGDLSDWPADTTWMPIDGRSSAAVAVSGDRLYAAWKTAEPRLLDNAGGEYRYLFKHGGALDLMLGTNAGERARQEAMTGDVRLLITRVSGQTRAVVYRGAVPGGPAEKRVEFASPVGRVFFDEVAEVNAQVRLAQKDGNYEVSLPLKQLGLVPRAGHEILGDVGLLRGVGSQTTQRTYWSNRNTTLVSDIPSEARLRPAAWGVWRFKE
jgi:hypothetical protein